MGFCELLLENGLDFLLGETGARSRILDTEVPDSPEEMVVLAKKRYLQATDAMNYDAAACWQEVIASIEQADCCGQGLCGENAR